MENEKLVLKDLKEGDMVIVRLSSGMLLAHPIEKITPKGFIRVKGNLYNSDTGEMRGHSEWTKSPVILVPTFELRSELYQQVTIRKARKIIEELPRNLDFDTAEKLVKMFEKK